MVSDKTTYIPTALPKASHLENSQTNRFPCVRFEMGLIKVLLFQTLRPVPLCKNGSLDLGVGLFHF